MSDSVKVVLIFYAGFVLSLFVSYILIGIITKCVGLLRRPKLPQI